MSVGAFRKISSHAPAYGAKVEMESKLVWKVMGALRTVSQSSLAFAAGRASIGLYVCVNRELFSRKNMRADLVLLVLLKAIAGNHSGHRDTSASEQHRRLTASSDVYISGLRNECSDISVILSVVSMAVANRTEPPDHWHGTSMGY